MECWLTMNKSSFLIAFCVVILLIWTNLYEYTSTDKLIYRSNRITHLTEFTYGKNEWEPVDEGLKIKPSEEKISNSNNKNETDLFLANIEARYPTKTKSAFADIDAEFSANDENSNPSEDGGDRELQVNKFE